MFIFKSFLHLSNLWERDSTFSTMSPSAMKNYCSGEEGGLSPQIFWFCFFFYLVPRTWTSFHRCFLKLSAWKSPVIMALQQCSDHSALGSRTSPKTSWEILKEKNISFDFKRHHCQEQLTLSNHSFYTRQFKLPVITANQSVIIPHFSHSPLLL